MASFLDLLTQGPRARTGLGGGLAQTGLDWAGYDPFNPPEWRSGAGLPSPEGTGPRPALNPQVTLPLGAAPPLPQTGGGAYQFGPADFPGQAFQQGPPPLAPNPLLNLLRSFIGSGERSFTGSGGFGPMLGDFYYHQLMRDTYGPWTVQE